MGESSRDQIKKFLKDNTYLFSSLHNTAISSIENETDMNVKNILDKLEILMLRKYEEGKLHADMQVKAMKVLYDRQQGR